MLHLNKKWHICGHKGIRGKCCQCHVQGMKLQKIRILTIVHPCPTNGSDPNH